MEFDEIEDVLEALKKGEIVIVTNDENRENEGDLISIAAKTTPETIIFNAWRNHYLYLRASLFS